MEFERREPIVLTTNNQKIFGVIHRPLDSEFSPAIVMCHGLAGNKIGNYRSFITASTELVKRGYTVFRFDYRGAGDSEGESQDMTLTSAITDTLEALNFLKEDPFVDSDRIAIFGRSFGGAVAIRAADKFPVKSIVLWAPIFHAKEWEEKLKLLHSKKLSLEEEDSLKRVNGQLMGDSFWKELFTMDANSALEKVSNTPLLHVQGEKDEVISLAQANFFRDARKQAKGQTNFVLLPDGDHTFSSPKIFKTAIEETISWFEETL